MIHQLLIYNVINLQFKVLYDDSALDLDPDLLIRLVHAMTILTTNMEGKGNLREAEFGDFQIGLIVKDKISYVVIQDKYDNEPFTSRILRIIIDNIHDKLSNDYENIPNLDDIKSIITELVQTMRFPKEILPQVELLFEQFQISTLNAVDHLLIADLDNGVVKQLLKADKSITRILMEILSEIPFEKRWVAETENIDKSNKDMIDRTKEVLFIFRIGMTDFTILGRGFYTPDIDKQSLIQQLTQFCEDIHSLIL